MRSTTGATHAPDPRLLLLMGQVSNHFGSRRVEVISGFRPYSPTQYTAHSNHNIGHALDFRVVGVPNEVLRDYCKTLKNVGVGYYPNSTFVHLDVRDTPATWVDYSKPGEPPRYNVPGVDADEGTSDVSEQAVTPESAAPSQAPLAPLPPDAAPPATPSPVEPAVTPPAPTPSALTPRADPERAWRRLRPDHDVTDGARPGAVARPTRVPHPSLPPSPMKGEGGVLCDHAAADTPSPLVGEGAGG